MVPGWVLAIGHGAVIVTAFATVARESSPAWRPEAVAGLLLTSVIGSQLLGLLAGSGEVGRIAVVAGILVTGVVAGLALAPGNEDAPRPALRPVVGAALLGIGVFIVLVAIDPSSALLLAPLTPLREEIGAIDLTRFVILAIGSAFVAVGATLAFRPLATWPGAWPIAIAIGAATITGSAAISHVPYVVLASDSGAVGIFGVATWAVPLGILAGGFWTGRTGSTRLPAMVGAALGAIGVALALWLLTADPEVAAPIGPAAASLGLVGAGFGAVTVVLRAILADAGPSVLAASAAIGAVAMDAGSAIGTFSGYGELPSGWAVAIGGMALACLAAALAVPRQRPGQGPT